MHQLELLRNSAAGIMIFFAFITCISTLKICALAQGLVNFQHISNTGSGCSSGSVITTTEANDQNSTDLVHILDNFAPRLGTNVSETEDRLECVVYTKVSFSEPNQRLYLNMDIGRVRGYLEIDSGTQVTFRPTYSWVGETRQVCSQ